jgi:hypothetical protein
MRKRSIICLLVVGSLLGGSIAWRHQAAAARRLAAWNQEQQDDAVFAVLEKPLELVCERLMLDQLAQRLSKATGLEFVIDTDAVSLAGVRPPDQTPVEVVWPSLSAASHLSLALKQLELCWTVRRGQVLITTPEVVENLPPRVVAYPLKPGTAEPDDASSWTQVITSTFQPDSWDNVGGRGHCEPAVGAVVVVHRTEIHRQIRTLFDRLQAQDDPPRSWQPLPIWPDSAQETSTAVFARLQRPATIDCQQMPLGELAQFLAHEHDVPLVLSHKKLEEASLSSQTPITAKLFGMSLHSLLVHVAKELELTFVVRDGVVQITTPEDAESQLIIVAYPVHDLVSVPPFNPRDARYRDFDSLIELITATIRPDSWDDVGGPGPIDSIGGYLLIAQTQDVHAQIESLLAGIRHTLDMGKTPLVFATPKRDVAEDQVRAALNRPLAASYCSTRLIDVCSDFSAQLSIPAYVSIKKMREASVSPDRPITCDFPVAPARVQLARILDPLDLAFVIRNEALVITTPEDAESQLITRIYDVRSLLESDVSLFDSNDSDTLISLITEHLSPGSWDDVGGPGAIDIFRDLLIVSQTQPVHDQIESLLAELRRAMLWRNQPSIMPATAPSTAEQQILAALRSEITLDYEERPLRQVCADLSRRLEIPVYPHPGHLTENVRHLDMPVTCHFPAAAARIQLNRLCDMLNLGLDIHNDLLTVTVPERVESRTTRLYDVRALVQENADGPNKDVSPNAGAPAFETDTFLNVLMRHVAPDSWREVGGAGKVDCIHGILVVSQTWQNHAAIESLLAQLRPVPDALPNPD